MTLDVPCLSSLLSLRDDFGFMSTTVVPFLSLLSLLGSIYQRDDFYFMSTTDMQFLSPISTGTRCFGLHVHRQVIPLSYLYAMTLASCPRPACLSSLSMLRDDFGFMSTPHMSPISAMTLVSCRRPTWHSSLLFLRNDFGFMSTIDSHVIPLSSMTLASYPRLAWHSSLLSLRDDIGFMSTTVIPFLSPISSQ